MPEGTVMWFDAKKGFGFIGSGEGNYFYVHFSSIKKGTKGTRGGSQSLSEGQHVRFDVHAGPKGEIANNVEIMPNVA